MRRTGFIRCTAALAVAVAALAATGVPGAAAAARPQRSVMFSPRVLAAMAPKSGLLHRMAAFLPGAAGPDVSTLALFTDPVTVTVNGVSYQMSLNVQNPPAAFDLPPQLAVELDRQTFAGGALSGEQDHVYGYAPLGGLHLTANAALSRATLRTGSSISPSAIDMRFHTTGAVQQTPCTLLGGGHGVFQVATGTLAAQTFKVATGTTPFFGTITTAPQTATVVHDPGCTSFIASNALGPVFHAPCSGRETIQSSTLTSLWFDEVGYGGKHLVQLGITETNPFGPAGIDHLAVGIGPGADMPRPVHTAGGGIRAVVQTAGVPFMGGRAVFTSTAAAHVSPGHACTWERHTHHFTTTRYVGRLTAAGSPLELMFDTGAEPVTPTPATLFLRSYTN